MGKSNNFENDLVKKVFYNVEFAWLPPTNVYLALHTADPGDGGGQSTNECAYTGYARIAVARDAGAWTVSGNQASNAGIIQFPVCSGGNAVATHFSIGTAATGTGQILYSGALTTSINISNNIRPEFAVGSLVIAED